MDLTTTYMGLTLKHPVVASASPLSQTLDGIRRLEDDGASAVVMFSLFEEQIRAENEAFDRRLGSGTDSFAESLDYFPAAGEEHRGTEHYLDLLRRAVEAVDVPVIASLNGVTNEGWIDYAQQMEQAGAHGVELNIYYVVTDPEQTGDAVEQRYLDILKTVKAAVSIPVAMKLSPFFTSMGHMAKQLDEAGADALVLFNRFFQPDFDLEQLEVAPTIQFSTSDEIRIPLLWIAVLYGRIEASLGATRGVQTADEVIKYLLAGADCVMTASALMEHGPQYLTTLVDGLTDWMEARGYESVTRMKGVMSRKNVADPTLFERTNYLRVLKWVGTSPPMT